MIATRRSLMWPLIVIAVGGVWLLVVADVFPDAVDDLFKRAWPALLILFGFDVLFGRRRLPVARWSVDTSLIGVVIVLVLVAGAIWFAYDKQGDVIHADNVVTFAESIPADVEQVQITVTVERTAVTINPSSAGPRDLSAEFKGSHGSDVVMDWSVDGTTGALTIHETIPGAIPKLADYGRGTLDITLPTAVIIEPFELTGASGDVAVDLSPIYMRRLVVAVDEGDILLYLPRVDVLQGNLETGDGGLALFVPPGTALDVKRAPGSGQPRYQYDQFRYDLLIDGELKPANTTAFQYVLDVSLKDGALLTITDLEE
jgi:hypothetical protein